MAMEERSQNAIEALDQIKSTDSERSYFVDNGSAHQIGWELANHTHLTTLKVKLHSDLEPGSVQAFLKGLKRSQIKSLQVEKNWLRNAILTNDVLHYLSVQAMQIAHIQSLILRFPLDDNIAHQMGTALVENTNLKKLEIDVGTSMTNDGAWRLACGLRQCTLETLKLIPSARAITDGPAMQILFLQALESIREVLLDYRLSNANALLLGRALLSNTSLKSLSLRIDNRLSPRVALSLARGIRLSKIVRLDLGDYSFSTATLETKRILYEGIRDARSVRHLSDGIGMSESDVLGTLLPRLFSFEITRHEISAHQLVQDLRDASLLLVLHLQPFLDTPQMMLLCEALPHLPSLTDLSMKGNLTCNEGADFVTEAILMNNNNGSSLRYEDLESRNIRAAVAEQLMMAVSNQRCVLKKLNLNGSFDVGFLGLDMITSYLPHVRLEELLLTDFTDYIAANNTNDEIVRQCCHKAGQALVAGVRSNVHVKVLSVNNIYLSSETMLEIHFYLWLNKYGRYLLHTNNEVATGLWSLVLAKCQDNADAMYYYLREQPMLVLGAENALMSLSNEAKMQNSWGTTWQTPETLSTEVRTGTSLQNSLERRTTVRSRICSFCCRCLRDVQM